MGAFANVLSGAEGLGNDSKTFQGAVDNTAQLLGGIAGVGKGISAIAGHPAGTPGAVPTTPMPGLHPATIAPHAPATPGAVPLASSVPATGVGTAGTPITGAAPVSLPGAAVTVPSVPMTGGIDPGTSGTLGSLYGAPAGNSITNLLNSETPGNSASTAQAIINANAPNVAKGSADLNTELAASGISPSSSVSAIENANYGAQVQQQNLSEEAQVGMNEQQLQQQLWESLLPGLQQQQADSSNWNIFDNVLTGLGDFAKSAVA